MSYNHLSDIEFRHYMELYNPDPVVQRLCKIDYDEISGLADELEEVKSDLESMESDYECLQEDFEDLKRENRILREKIQVWDTLGRE